MPPSEKLPPDFYLRPLAYQAVDRTMALFPEEDLYHLEALREVPGATFSLVRPLLNPSQESLAPMQQAIQRELLTHPTVAEWDEVGIMKTEHLGATYFDGEPRTFADRDALQEAGALKVALNICAALPDSVTKPTTAVMEKVALSSPKSARYLAGLALVSDQLFREFSVPDLARHHLTSSNTMVTTRVPAHLALVCKARGPQSMPHISLLRAVQHGVPKGTTVHLDRLRLRVHMPQESPYLWLK